MPAASLYACREGLRGQGTTDNQSVLVTESLMDSKSLFLTPSTQNVYNLMWLDLHEGPLVIEMPPGIVGIIDDFWFNYVGDLGAAGPDRGKGGKFLLLPPGFAGEVPQGYFVFRSKTYGNPVFWCSFLVDGDPKPAVMATKKLAKLYSLVQADKPPAMKFINISGHAFSTVPPNDFTFFEAVNHVVQEEPKSSVDPETLGLLASIGIEKGKPFAPDARMKKILTDAAAVGNATSRVILFRNRIKEAQLYPNSAWQEGFIGGNYQFLDSQGVLNLDARTFYFYYATGITPAMATHMVGFGSQYALAFTDALGEPLDGGKTYKVHLPAPIPAKNFWSFILYDNQTRSELQTDQEFPVLSSQGKDRVVNDDKSVDVWFAAAELGKWQTGH